MAKSARPGDALAGIERVIEVVAGRPATSEMLDRFAKYLALLVSWNRTHHLTAYRTPRDMVRGLFIDSLLFIPLLPPRPHRLLDIGTGPGIPGVPLRIVDPDLALTLIESRRKPVSFLAVLKRELGLPEIDVVHGRAGHESEDLKGKYDCIVMRGVRLDDELLEAVRALLKPTGRLVVAAAPDRDAPPLPHVRVQKISYPGLGLSRHFIVVPD